MIEYLILLMVFPWFYLARKPVKLLARKTNTDLALLIFNLITVFMITGTWMHVAWKLTNDIIQGKVSPAGEMVVLTALLSMSYSVAIYKTWKSFIHNIRSAQ